MNEPTPEERARMVNGALKKSGFIDRHKHAAPTPEEQCILRAKDAASLVQQQINTILSAAKAGGKPFDPIACQQTIHMLLLDAFKGWSKDDLLFLAAVIQAGIMMEGIVEANKQGIV